MKGTPRALLIDPDNRTRDAIRQALASSGRVGVIDVAASYQGGVGLLGTSACELVMINLDHDRDAALRVLRHAATLDPRTPLLPASADPDSSLVLSAMRAGAREFLVLPPNPVELAQILERLLQAPGDRLGEGRSGAGLVAVAGTVGGVGCTTLAVNLAVALAKRTQDSVLLADFDLLFGSVDVALDLLPDFTLLEATQRIDRVDEALLRRAVARHPTGVQILARPIELEDAAKIDPEALRRLLMVAKNAFPSVLIDTSKGLQASDFVAFEAADKIVVVIQLDLFGLRNAARLLKLLRQYEGLGEKVKLVANRVGAFDAEINLKKAEGTLGAPIDWQLPNATRQIHEAHAKGVPVVADGTRSKVQQAMLDIARDLSPEPSPSAVGKARRGFFSGLFRSGPDLSAIGARPANRSL
jgi:pilus assembly protein CpaE